MSDAGLYVMPLAPMDRLWAVAPAWRVACETTALTYGVQVGLLTAPSRGRGPRPPAAVWEAKKIAVHVTVTLAGCSYWDLGRVIGLCRDTVSSHCADVRDRLRVDPSAEARLVAIERLARIRLMALERRQLDALRAHLALMEQAVAEFTDIPSSDAHPTFHPTLLMSKAELHAFVNLPFEGEA